MDLISALDKFREAMAATQQGVVEAFVDALTTLPQSMRPAVPGAPFPGAVDERLDLFAMFYWDMRHWPLRGWGIPDEIDPVTTLDALPNVLPSILAKPLAGTQGTLPPQPEAVRADYLRDLHELVMEKAKHDHAPSSLPADYESLLKLTDGLSLRDLLAEDICEVGGAVTNEDLEDLVPELDELTEYQEWDVSAGFVLGKAPESYYYYLYCYKAGEDASEHEGEWAWRISFTSFSQATQEPYIGDLAGFLDYYANIYQTDKIQEYVGYRVQHLRQMMQSTSQIV